MHNSLSNHIRERHNQRAQSFSAASNNKLTTNSKLKYLDTTGEWGTEGERKRDSETYWEAHLS